MIAEVYIRAARFPLPLPIMAAVLMTLATTVWLLFFRNRRRN